jgi:hypothetical protein
MTGPNHIKQYDRAPENDFVNDECAEFQASLADRIGAGEDLKTHPHLLTCDRCSALLRDLEAIAEAARQLMPVEEEPSDEVWSQLQIKLASERGG